MSGNLSSMSTQERQCARDMGSLKEIDIDRVARAIEDDAGHALSGLRESLAQAKAGDFIRSNIHLLSEHGSQAFPPSEASLVKGGHGE